jgi:hypothetical protein
MDGVILGLLHQWPCHEGEALRKPQIVGSQRKTWVETFTAVESDCWVHVREHRFDYPPLSRKFMKTVEP